MNVEFSSSILHRLFESNFVYFFLCGSGSVFGILILIHNTALYIQQC